MMQAAGDRLDWDRLVRQTVRRSLMLPVIDALAFLRAELNGNVPAGVIETLRSVPVSPLLVAEHRVRMQPRTMGRQARYHWIRHRRLNGGSSLVAVGRYPEYLRRVWGLPSYAALMRHVVGRLADSAKRQRQESGAGRVLD